VSPSPHALLPAAGDAPPGRGSYGFATAPAPGPRAAAGAIELPAGIEIGRRPRDRPARKLRRALDAGLAACLSVLGARERRVVLLRAYGRHGRPQSRRRVARSLELTARKVRRIERRALVRLRRAAARGRCGTTSEAAAVAGPATPAGVAATAPPDGGTGAVAGRRATSRDALDVKPPSATDRGLPGGLVEGTYRAAETLLERLLNPVVIAAVVVMLLALAILVPRVVAEHRPMGGYRRFRR
jgi:Sigma-70, region 4